ncbi:hypothetical protein [Nocardia asiatica]|uniref:hypothetical protein n=1 Tax=Nocardia asiatica TaxID=209252 RepID=UPI003EE2A266
MNSPVLPCTVPCQRRLLYDVDHDQGQFRTNRTHRNLGRRHQRSRAANVARRDGRRVRPRFGNVPYVDNWELHTYVIILFDYLLPLLGPEQAAYWAQVFVINPV